MSYSEQLEREAEQARLQVEGTLQELRERFTPGQMVDQLVDYAKHGSGSELVHNLGRRTVENPLPLALVGAGLAWLMLANGRSNGHGPALTERSGLGERAGELTGTARATAHDMRDSARATAHDVRDTARSTASSIAETARQAGARLSGAAKSVMHGAGDGAAGGYERASGGARRAASAIGSSASQLGHGAADRTRNLVEFCKEQPLVLAGVGIALGAAVGAMFPATEAEARLMGETGDKLKSDMARKMSEANGSTESEYRSEGQYREYMPEDQLPITDEPVQSQRAPM